MRQQERLEKEETEENARRAEREYQNQIEVMEEKEEEECQIFDQDKRISSTTVQSSANQVGRSSGEVNCKLQSIFRCASISCFQVVSE